MVSMTPTHSSCSRIVPTSACTAAGRHLRRASLASRGPPMTTAAASGFALRALMTVQCAGDIDEGPISAAPSCGTVSKTTRR